MLFGKYPRYAEYQAGGAGHIRIYTPNALKRQLLSNGLCIVQCVGCNTPMPMHAKFIPGWIKRTAAWAGDYFPGISGQAVLAAINR
ncbi:MAG: hypothetical protein WCG06_04685 [Candidatus Omnitrophota bacterium]